jgi:hypothetical protein
MEIFIPLDLEKCYRYIVIYWKECGDTRNGIIIGLSMEIVRIFTAAAINGLISFTAALNLN